MKKQEIFYRKDSEINKNFPFYLKLFLLFIYACNLAKHLVSLFSGILTFMGYVMPKPSL